MARMISDHTSRAGTNQQRAEGPGYSNHTSRAAQRAESAEEPDFTVSELYGCICHQAVHASALTKISETQRPGGAHTVRR